MAYSMLCLGYTAPHDMQERNTTIIGSGVEEKAHEHIKPRYDIGTGRGVVAVR